MQRKTQTNHPQPEEAHKIGPDEREERKARVLTHGIASVTSSIADAVIIKSEDLFFLTRPDAMVPLQPGHGFGLYYHDCRFLNGYELRIAGTTPDMLIGSAEHSYAAVF